VAWLWSSWSIPIRLAAEFVDREGIENPSYIEQVEGGAEDGVRVGVVAGGDLAADDLGEVGGEDDVRHGAGLPSGAGMLMGILPAGAGLSPPEGEMRPAVARARRPGRIRGPAEGPGRSRGRTGNLAC
jgi:hypothetical protein